MNVDPPRKILEHPFLVESTAEPTPAETPAQSTLEKQLEPEEPIYIQYNSKARARISHQSPDFSYFDTEQCGASYKNIFTSDTTPQVLSDPENLILRWDSTLKTYDTWDLNYFPLKNLNLIIIDSLLHELSIFPSYDLSKSHKTPFKAKLTLSILILLKTLCVIFLLTLPYHTLAFKNFWMENQFYL
jgi:hypothetical protein